MLWNVYTVHTLLLLIQDVELPTLSDYEIIMWISIITHNGIHCIMYCVKESYLEVTQKI